MLDALPAGINISAVFNINTLPDDIRNQLKPFLEADTGFSQLILLGHGGTDLWKAIAEQGTDIDSPDPVDDYTLKSLSAWFNARHIKHSFLYPMLPHAHTAADKSALKPIHVPLQTLGLLAGWHHSSPMKVGINRQWGLWYAYRAVVLADSTFPADKQNVEGSSLERVNNSAAVSSSPCDTCSSKPCISACPADALSEGTLRFERCAAFRLQPNSPCAQRCLAREACPVAVEHRYSTQQIQYHYSRSLETLKRYYT